ncbi:class I SAM-dependent methyltransferase [Pedobacter gandavensis]|uniref:class I SAM-dependent methyltransferase n=1 Tax=Pedobacter gandavensis TaxID=2679963 RepID=UPI00292F1A4B|nr:class I SAM-dependent methyltransferase [Pedobacter gandavensis]
MLNNYDHIARYYDSLSRLIFFKSQVNAQVHQLRFLPEKGRVLIVGGGTGWILEEIAKLRPEGLVVVYVEISAKMMALSMNREIGGNQVDFVHLGIEDFSSDQRFDVICTPFLFDNFAPERAAMVFKQLDNLLKNEGLWLHTDFNLGERKEGKVTGRNGTWWKTAFLSLMYHFFKFAGNVEASKLINMLPYFVGADYKISEEKYYYRKFIQSMVFKKKNQ